MDDISITKDEAGVITASVFALNPPQEGVGPDTAALRKRLAAAIQAEGSTPRADIDAFHALPDMPFTGWTFTLLSVAGT